MTLSPITAKFGAAAIVAAIGLAAPVLAQDDEAHSPLAANQADGTSASTRVVCRRYPPPVGTRIGARRICKTEREWQQAEAEQRYVLERVQRNINACPPNPSC